MIDRFVGSGDVGRLLSGKKTIGHRKLLEEFVTGRRVRYDAKATSISWMKAGAVMEDIFLQYLDGTYFPQWKCVCAEYSCCRSTIDFAKVESRKVKSFIEFKTLNMLDFMGLKADYEIGIVNIDYLKKKYKGYYNQVQFQLLCSGLDCGQLEFYGLKTYDVDILRKEGIDEKNLLPFIIDRDEEIIDLIRDRIRVFQYIKDFYV